MVRGTSLSSDWRKAWLQYYGVLDAGMTTNASYCGQGNAVGSHHNAATTACFLILGLIGGFWHPWRL
jgi:hypothetical protein